MNNPFEDYFKECDSKKITLNDDFFTEVMLRGTFEVASIPEQMKGFKDATLYLLDHGVPGTIVLHAMSLIVEGFKTNETDED